MKYKTKPQKPVIVDAFESAFSGFLKDGKTPIQAGDWLVTWPDGKQKIIPGENFRDKFSVVRKRNKPRLVEARES